MYLDPHKRSAMLRRIQELESKLDSLEKRRDASHMPLSVQLQLELGELLRAIAVEDAECDAQPG
jgi:hypothetical protein